MERVIREPDIPDNRLAPEFMINRIEDFYEDYIARETLDLNNQIPFRRPNFNRIRETVRNKRLQNTEPTNKKNSLKKYYKERKITNDPQNVHDSQVGNDIKNVYDRIRQKNSLEEGFPTLEEIKSAILKHKFTSADKQDRALRAFEKLSQKNLNTKLNTTEDQILLNVWKRINSPENAAHRVGLRDVLFDSMADSIELNRYGEYMEVCLVGRCNRILQSLTLLDKDPEIATPIKTTEILRNEILSKSYVIIQNELKKAPLDVSNAYNGITYIGPHQAALTENQNVNNDQQNLNAKIKEFENKTKLEIERLIRQEYIGVDPKILDNLIKDAQAGV